LSKVQRPSSARAARLDSPKATPRMSRERDMVLLPLRRLISATRFIERQRDGDQKILLLHYSHEDNACEALSCSIVGRRVGRRILAPDGGTRARSGTVPR